MSPLTSDLLDRLNPNYNFTAEFIETYKSLPCLWDPKSPKYYKRKARQRAYRQIIDKFKEVNPDINEELVCKKINNVRSTCRKEMRKIQASKDRGDAVTYKPSLWYFHQLDFLYSTENEQKESTEGEDGSQDVKLEFCSVNEIDDEANSHETDRVSDEYLQNNQENVNQPDSTIQERCLPFDALSPAGSTNDTSLPGSPFARETSLLSPESTSVNSKCNFKEQLIEMYKALPCLWDPKHTKYFNRSARQKAYTQIIDKFKEVNFEISEELVCRKIDNLRRAYRLELRKVQASKKRGVTYKPNLWYFHRLDFLHINDTFEEEIETAGSEDCDSQEMKLEFCSVNEVDDDTNSYEISRASPIYLQNNKEIAVSINHETVQPHATQKSDFLAGSKNDTSLPCASSHRLKDTRNTLLEPNLYGSVNSVAPSNHQRSAVPIAASVYEKFGAYIADELTIMQPHVSAVCQKLINDVIFEAKCGTISRNSRIVT